MKNFKKLRFGGVAIALTAIIIAVIVLGNVVFTSLAMENMWYVDMTPNSINSLTDACLEVIQNGVKKYNDDRIAAGEDKVSINIYFCSEPDELMGNESMRYIYDTARMLAEKCDFINIDYLNWRYNPSTVEKYKTAGSTINAYSVIVDASEYFEDGSRWFAYSALAFYAKDESGNIIGYNGERVFASAILSAANLATPIAYVPINHGERITSALYDTLTHAGYLVEEVDISKKDFEFSENGRLLVIFNPTSDFLVGNGGSVNELEKIDEFLDDARSMMVFMSPNSPVLPNFEEYLETWGIVFERYSDANENKYSYAIRDTQGNSYSSDGYSLRGEYFTKGEIGADIEKRVTQDGERVAPNVVFENSMSIAYSSTFREKRYEDASDPSKDYTFAYSELDYTEKYVFDLFTAPKSAVAVAAGQEVDRNNSINKTVKDVDGKTYSLNATEELIVDEKGSALAYQDGEFITPSGTRLEIVTIGEGENAAKSILFVSAGDTDSENSPYKLMTMSVKKKTVYDQENDQKDIRNSYVLCCGSTEYASAKYLQSQIFGNSDVLLAATQIMGREIVPVTGVALKTFKSYEISDLTEAEANQYTALLCILPPVLVFGTGAVVLIRRKYS